MTATVSVRIGELELRGETPLGVADKPVGCIVRFHADAVTTVIAFVEVGEDVPNIRSVGDRPFDREVDQGAYLRLVRAAMAIWGDT